MSWVTVSGDTVPLDAFCAGYDTDDTPLYIGRAFNQGELMPGKFSPSKRTAFFGYGSDEIPKKKCEVLAGVQFSWMADTNGNVPPNAIRGGYTKGGEPLYIGRAQHLNSLTPGKICKSHGCMYFTSDGALHNTKQYEVLCSEGLIQSVQSNQCDVEIVPPKACSGGLRQWVQSSTNGCFPEYAHIGGNDVDGTPIYIGRANHDGELLVGKIIKKILYVASCWKETHKENFEVLCHGNLQWIKSGDGHIPNNAVPGGHALDGETLYIGRTNHMDSLTVGKVHPSHKKLYIPFSGTEVSFGSYEILIEN